MDEELDRRGDRLQGKVAVVIGGGSTGERPGTGSAMARLFAAQGAKVAVVGRTAQNTERTVEQIVAAGDDAIAVLGDSTVAEDCDRVVATVAERYGALDVLVNNLGTTTSTSLEDFDLDTWNRAVATNLTANLLMTSRALPLLEASGRGAVINVGSVTGLQASGGIGYGVTKGAVIPLTRDMAMNLGRHGVRVNCIIPGHLHTPAGTTSVVEDLQPLRNSLNMMGSEGTGWDAAWTALFLASDEARFVTGQCINVDGGVTGVLTFTQVLRMRAAQS